MSIALLAVEAAGTLAPPSTSGVSEQGAEPAEWGEGVTPVEIIPRLELRQSFQQSPGGISVHDTTPEMDIEFLKRLLLRFQVPHRTMETPTNGELSGFGDVQLTVLGVISSRPTALWGVLAGVVLNTATLPQLGAGKQQIVFGGGGAFKPFPWLLPYAVLQEQLSVAGDESRPDVDELSVDLGAVVFGRQYNWLKLDLIPTADFPGGTVGRLFGTLEVGSLIVDRVGLFVRAETQLLGRELLDYSIAGGLRYLFRLQQGKPPTGGPDRDRGGIRSNPDDHLESLVP